MEPNGLMAGKVDLGGGGDDDEFFFTSSLTLMAQPLVEPSRCGKEGRSMRIYRYTELHVQLNISKKDRCLEGWGERRERAKELGKKERG